MLRIIKGRNCRKCGSHNLYLDRDEPSGWCEHCLTCGYTRPIKQAKPARIRTA